jgi:hypothetical protein
MVCLSNTFNFEASHLIIRSDRSDKSGYIHNTNAFIPFSYGPANCIGRALAKREMLMVVVTLLRKFDMSFAPGYLEEGGGELGSRDHKRLDRWEKDLCDYFVSMKGALRVVLRER